MASHFRTFIAHEAGNKTLAAGATLFAVLITITPYCGHLFECGCTWPGLGLDSACNIHDHRALHQCPWCASPFAGWLSVGFAALAGLIATICPLFSFNHRSSVALIIRILSGIGVFLAAAMISAMISAYVQDYPMGFLRDTWIKPFHRWQ